MQRYFLGFLFIACAAATWPQTVGRIDIVKADRPAIAVPDLKGSGDAAKFMAKFNETLWNELENSGVLKMAAKSAWRYA